LSAPSHPESATRGELYDIRRAEAREKPREAIAALRRGFDVNAKKRRVRDAETWRRKQARQVRAETGFEPDSFGAIATHYITQECARLARGGEVEKIIRRSLLGPWGERPLAELRRRDLTRLLDPIVETGRSQAAHKLREIALRI